MDCLWGDNIYSLLSLETSHFLLKLVVLDINTTCLSFVTTWYQISETSSRGKWVMWINIIIRVVFTVKQFNFIYTYMCHTCVENLFFCGQHPYAQENITHLLWKKNEEWNARFFLFYILVGNFRGVWEFKNFQVFQTITGVR